MSQVQKKASVDGPLRAQSRTLSHPCSAMDHCHLGTQENFCALNVDCLIVCVFFFFLNLYFLRDVTDYNPEPSKITSS